MTTRRSPDRPATQRLPAPQPVAVEALHLDADNPRIRQVGDGLDEGEILRILWREYSVEEVAMSIAHNGFFDHEPLFAAEEGDQLVVVEGNRRLAAVRLLRSRDLRERLNATDLPEITEQRHSELDTLPVIHCRRTDIWQYIGFKHVNGPQAWNSFAKAEYIARVKNAIGADLAEIASTIGDTHLTVARLYRAYMALKQAEDSGVYDREQRTRSHFSFSHLYTGLDYQGIRNFTKIADLVPATEKPIPRTRLKQFGELCVWLWGDEGRHQPALVRSQNPHLRQLDGALQSNDGLAALRAGYGLSRSVDVARGDTALFREALLNAKQSLQDARGKVVTGFTGEADLSREMDQILALADALYEDMSQAAVDRRSRRRRQDRAQ